MITKIITAKGGQFAVETDGRYRAVETYYGMSSDEKPTTGVNNADRFFEMDTCALFVYDESGKQWIPV